MCEIFLLNTIEINWSKFEAVLQVLANTIAFQRCSLDTELSSVLQKELLVNYFKMPDGDFQRDVEKSIEDIQRETHTKGTKNFTIIFQGEKTWSEQNRILGVPTYTTEKSEMFECWNLPFQLDAKTSDNDPERTVSYLNKYVTTIMREITNHCFERVSHVPCDEKTDSKISWKLSMKNF